MYVADRQASAPARLRVWRNKPAERTAVPAVACGGRMMPHLSAAGRALEKIRPSPVPWRRAARMSAQMKMRRWALGDKGACSTPRVVRTWAVERWILIKLLD